MQAVRRRARSGVAASVTQPVFWPVLVLLVVYALAYVQFAAQFAFPFDFDQGEGYDAWSGWLINLGQLPYTSNASFPYYSSNYPPLWSYLVSIPMAWLGPRRARARRFHAGRPGRRGSAVVRRAAFLGGTIGRGTRRRLLSGSPYVFHTTPLARVNSLALLAAVVGLTLLDGRLTRQRVVFGSLALAAALFTKPTAIDRGGGGPALPAARRRAPGDAGRRGSSSPSSRGSAWWHCRRGGEVALFHVIAADIHFAACELVARAFELALGADGIFRRGIFADYLFKRRDRLLGPTLIAGNVRNLVVVRGRDQILRVGGVGTSRVQGDVAGRSSNAAVVVAGIVESVSRHQQRFARPVGIRMLAVDFLEFLRRRLGILLLIHQVQALVVELVRGLLDEGIVLGQKLVPHRTGAASAEGKREHKQAGGQPHPPANHGAGRNGVTIRIRRCLA